MKTIEDYDREIQQNPNSELYISRGIEYNYKCEYDLAIADFNQAIYLDPNNEKAFCNRGFAYFSKDDYDRAIADYSDAIRLDPNDANSYFGRGCSYAKRKREGDYDRAIADHSDAIRLDPNDKYMYYERGLLYHVVKNHTMAIADYESALRLGLSDSLAVTAREQIKKIKDDQKGNSQVDIDEIANEAFASLVNGDHKKANQLFEKAAEQGHMGAQYALGEAYNFGIGAGKDGRKAAYWYKKAALQGHGQAQWHLAVLFERGELVFKNRTKAKYWFSRAKKTGNEDALAHESKLARMAASYSTFDPLLIFFYVVYIIILINVLIALNVSSFFLPFIISAIVGCIVIRIMRQRI